MNPPEEILIVGTGNLAAHLVSALSKAGGYWIHVASRDHLKAQKFCNRFGGTPFSEKETNVFSAVFLAVTDQVIEETAARYARYGKILFHTSGSTSMEALKNHHHAYGVFWPLQTFSQDRPVQWSDLPVCLESSNADAEKHLQQIVASLGAKAVNIDSAHRIKMHIAAVFVCNFTNHLYALADIWCRENQLDFDLLKPLISETANKIQNLSPPEAQTGPAKRHDVVTMNKHTEQLQNHPSLLEIYELISRQIQHRYKI